MLTSVLVNSVLIIIYFSAPVDSSVCLEQAWSWADKIALETAASSETLMGR